MTPNGRVPIWRRSWRSGASALILQAISRFKRSLAGFVLASTLMSPALAPLPAQAQGDQVLPDAPFRISTLETIRARGYIVCAASSLLPGFAQISPEGLWSGFDIDLCRAVATAIFGDPSRVEFRPLSGTARFAHVAMGDVDLVVRNAPWTMSRDTQYGTHYVATSFYDGQAFMVSERLDAVSMYELEDVTICVESDSEAALNLEEFFFANQVNYDELLYEDREDLAVAYRSGQCDAITASASWLQATRRTMPDPGAHAILPERLSREPYGPVVRDGDPQWDNIVRLTLFTIINAEEYGITSVNIESMMSARTPGIRRMLGVEGDYGSALGLSETWMRDVIRAVGNYGEIYNRHFGTGTTTPLLRGQNALWINGGLLYAPPLN